MTQPRRESLVLVLALALVARLAAGLWWESRLSAEQQFFFGDSHTYWVLAQRIVRGEPYYYGSPETTSVFRTPGYPLVLAGLFSVVGDDPPVLWARALSAALGTFAVGGVYWIARQLFSARAALLAALIAAVYPGAVSLGAMVLSEAPFCPLMLLQLGLWIASVRATQRTQSLSLAGLAGIAAGLATLARPSWLLFTPFAAGLAILFRKDRKQHLVSTAVMMFALCLTMLPWWVRNFQVTGRFVATTLQTGASLYDGLNPNADGSSNMSFVGAFHTAEHAEQAAGTSEDTFEYRFDQRLRREAIAWAKAHPQRVIRLAGIKLARMWNVWPNESEFRSWTLRIVIALTYAPLTICALLGIWKFSRRGWPFVLLWLPAVYLSLIHMIFVGSLRYREPVMLPLIVLAAGFIAEAARGNRNTAAD